MTRMLHVTEVPHDPWSMVPSENGYDTTLDPELTGAAWHVIDKAGPGDLTCRECAKSVGLVETSHEDTYGREIERVEWFALVVVADHAKPRFDDAWVLCEDCASGLTS